MSFRQQVRPIIIVRKQPLQIILELTIEVLVIFLRVPNKCVRVFIQLLVCAEVLIILSPLYIFTFIDFKA
ncbi:MAG: hypothetical protein CL902_01100 [Dehalococcoidia bacterium]|nr:hypothetical protein [Dehalococcoidia bacterium]